MIDQSVRPSSVLFIMASTLTCERDPTIFISSLETCLRSGLVNNSFSVHRSLVSCYVAAGTEIRCSLILKESAGDYGCLGGRADKYISRRFQNH